MLYSFQARSRDGRLLKGLRDVPGPEALALELAGEGAFLVKAEPARAAERRGGRARIRRKELAAFLLHLASYVEAGVPLMAALQDYRVPEQQALDEALQDLRRRIEGGSSLSEAMAVHPELFKPLYVSMVKAGETGGRLDTSLLEVVRLVEWEEAFSAQVKQASTYPIIVLSILGLVILVVSLFALPAILKLLRDFNVPLPLVTRVFMQMGDVLVRYGWLLVLGPALVYGVIKVALRDEGFRLTWDTWRLRIPVVGGLLTRMGLSRFANFFAAQYRSGLPILQILEECEGVTGNARLALSVRSIREGVERGERLAPMAAMTGYFPQLAVRMLAIGEEAGNLETTLGKVSAYFDAEVAAAIRRFFQILEPTLVVCLAGVLIFVAAAILLPIYTLIGGIHAG